MSWVIAGVPDSASTGGAMRARHVFGALAQRTGGRVISAHGRRGQPALAAAILTASRGWRRPVRLASTQLLPRRAFAVARGLVQPALLDLHDHPRLQAEALGVRLAAEAARSADRLVDANVDRFRWLAVPSASFVDLCHLPTERVIVVPNGADTEWIVPRPPPAEPVVAMVSGAAPGRGIEALVEAVRLVRAAVPEATLRLALAPTGPASAAYLHDLEARLRVDHDWVELERVANRDLPAFLGAAAVLAVPHPAGTYYDVSTPVKLFDSMAAGRPLVVTPRYETRTIVDAAQAGIVASSDSAEDLAEAILTLVRSAPLRRELGDNARRAAVERYDWRFLSARLADAILGPEEGSAA